MNSCDQRYWCVNVIESEIAVDLLSNIYVVSKHWVKTVFGIKKWKRFNLLLCEDDTITNPEIEQSRSH